MTANIIVARNDEEVQASLKRVITDALADNPSGEVFSVALSGGSFVKVLTAVLPQLQLTADDWRRWVFFFADERFVGFDDPDSTYGQYKAQLLGVVPELGLNQFVIINPQAKDAKECAFDYYSKMKRSFTLPLSDKGFPQFDLVLLGMGPDGHTASLFPGHPLLNVSDARTCLSCSVRRPPAACDAARLSR